MGKDEIQNSPCHYRRHLKGAALSVYEFAVVVSRTSGEFFAGVSRICRETRYHHETVTAALQRLCKDGWLQFLGGNDDRDTRGHFKPNHYSVVGHEEWASIHHGKCEDIDRGGISPSRQNTVTVKSADTVTVKSADTVTVKPLHKLEELELEERRDNNSLELSLEENLKRRAKEEAVTDFPLPTNIEAALEKVCDAAASLWNTIIALADDNGGLEWEGNLQVVGWSFSLDESLCVDYWLDDLQQAGLVEVSPNEAIPAGLIDNPRKVKVIGFEGWQHYKALLLEANPDVNEHRSMVQTFKRQPVQNESHSTP